jgi:protein-S-isoprenylcysteine O-methyltransferase Ste14
MKYLRSAGFGFVTVLIYLGIPLLGWGPGDWEGFFSQSPRAAYGLMVVVLGMGVVWQSFTAPEGFRGGKGREEALVFRQQFIKNTAIAMLYLALTGLPFADRRGFWEISHQIIFRWMGVVVFGVGIGLVFWSGVALGKLYSADVTLQEGHRLITDGPYRMIRHPRYAGSILLAFGLGLVFNSWVGFLGGILYLPLILFRIRDEESLMREAFGEEWKGYCERSKRLIPYLY